MTKNKMTKNQVSSIGEAFVNARNKRNSKSGHDWIDNYTGKLLKEFQKESHKRNLKGAKQLRYIYATLS